MRKSEENAAVLFLYSSTFLNSLEFSEGFNCMVTISTVRWPATLGDTRTYLRHWYRQASPWVTRSQGTTSPVATISQQNHRPFKSPRLSNENRDESNLSILSNNNRISALSDDSDPLVSS